MRKITVILPSALIESAMEVSGANLTETLRTALRDDNHRAASRRLLVMGGHRPGVVCGGGARDRGIKLGPLPCAFAPSPSPWMPEVDVRPR
jgi:hypothetical protein